MRCICETGQDTAADCPLHGCTCDQRGDDRDCYQHGRDAQFFERVDYEYDRWRDE